ncbi:MAG: tetratricopeptide repeat protein [Acidobacteria bacterium]|nr:tetratricopeptide repeat protein [Acidobacteriota bacterium]
MKAQERHHLKQNEFVTSVASATSWYRGNQGTVIGIVVGALAVVVAVSGYFWWQNRAQEQAGSLLGVAMTIYQAPVVPPSSVPGATQAPGSYPSEKARYEAALAAFQQVADKYPSAQAGLAARYHSGETLMSLGRTNDAQQAYQQVIDKGGSSIYTPMARLGLATVLLSSGQNDQGLKMLEELSAQRDGLVPVDGVLMQLGAAYAKLGKKAEARTTYKRVVDEFPDSPYAQNARQQMTLLG